MPEKGEFYQEILNSSRYRNIQWVVVITDFFSDYSEADFEEYMATYGRGAMRVHDEAKLWKALSEDPSVPTRATTFAMNKDMDTYVINRSGTAKDAILEAALRLAAEVNGERE